MTPTLKIACAAALLVLPSGLGHAALHDTMSPEAANVLFDAALTEAEACPMVFDLTAQGPTQMDVFVVAPCHAGQSVVLDHAGLVLRLKASESGTVSALLPILDLAAPVTLTFADGKMAEATLVMAISNIQDTSGQH